MTRIDRTGLLTIVTALLIMLVGATDARACPNCKEAVSLQSGEAANQSNGYNWSVIFMITVPFSMMGTGAFAIHRAVKRGALPEL
jgi:choline-glycine betaine transporter